MISRASGCALGVVAILLAAGCAEDDPPDPEAARLVHACETHVCPDPPPRFISCMPVVPDDWRPVCEQACASFLGTTCHIEIGL